MNLIDTKISYVPLFYIFEDHVTVALNSWLKYVVYIDSWHYSWLCFNVPEVFVPTTGVWSFLDYVEDIRLVVLFVSHQILNPIPMHLSQLLYYLLLPLSQNCIFGY